MPGNAPSTAACKRRRAQLRTEVRALGGANAEAVLRRLIPIVRGWAAYYLAVASTNHMAGTRSRGVTREQAWRGLTVNQIKACPHCRPDTEFGVLD
ncbi:DUF6233 domain-containing protein [Streptomyces sp. NPDC054866]